MKAVVHGTQIELEPNSKPFLLKRFLSDGFDILLIFGLFMLFTNLILSLPAAETYHTHYDRYTEIEEEVKQQYQDPEEIGKALKEHEEYQFEVLAANLNGYVIKAVAALVAEAIILLLIPLVNKGRATPGKLMTGILPFNEKRQSTISFWQVFSRFLFVFLIDSLGLYLLTGIMTFFLVPVLRLMEMLLNKKNKTICDFITGTMVIEKLSYDGIN